jgi:hypothetical protein
MMDDPGPASWPYLVPPRILPREATCPHCYCNEAPEMPYRTGPHRACCKCSDVRAVRFLAGVAGLLPGPEGGAP